MRIVYATTNAIVALDGGAQINVRAGTHWPADDPAVLAQPSIFSTDPQHGLSFSVPPSPPPVEQASAAPGERRPVDPRSMRRAT